MPELADFGWQFATTTVTGNPMLGQSRLSESSTELGGGSHVPAATEPVIGKKRLRSTEILAGVLVEPGSSECTSTFDSIAAQSGVIDELPKQVKSEGTEGKAVVKEFEWPINSNLSADEISDLTEILDEFRDVFAFDTSELGVMEGETFRIKLTDETPIFKQQYRLSQSEKEILCEQMEERKAVGFIRVSNSEWAAPVTMPPKKDEHGNWTLKRPCVDYRALNSKTPTDHYPLPTPEDIFDALSDSVVFTTLDLRMGYHQVRIADEDCCKTAFWCLDGLHEWTVVPFGLKNAPPFFQRVMDQTLVNERHCARCFIDDVIIFSKSLAEHKQHLRQVLGRLRNKNIKCHPVKMRVAFPDVEYLGHKVVPRGTAPMAVKVEAIVKMLPPTNVSELRAVLGTANYYRKFVKDYSTIAAPLNNLLREDVTWDWSTECQSAFDTIKERLTQAPILRRPDYSRDFELHTDWSGVGLGAVLVQKDDEGREYVIAYASRSNNRTERNYSSYAGECLAAVWGVSHFRVYLYGRRFTLLTDHEPLKWLMTNEKLTGMHARWAHILSEYDFEVKHRSGVKSGDADGLSRNPLRDETDLTDARMDHDASVFLPATVSAGLAQLAYTGAVALEAADANDKAENLELAENSSLPFSGSHKDGVREVAHPRTAQASRDIWLDEGTLQYLKEKTFSSGVDASERDRIQHRAKGYYFLNGLLRKKEKQGTGKIDKVVPSPKERTNLIRAIHIDVGHFGVYKTYSLLEPTYFWSGMFSQVRREVSSCTICDRVKASFEVKDTTLKPLPIMGLFYRWGVDLCKLPFKSSSGNKYVVVMIEHFSKWIELVAIPAKKSHHTAAALRGVLCRYGAPAEVLTDQGEEFQGEFGDLLSKLLIDHRLTSRDHPQSDGLAERMVQTIKEALRKFVLKSNRRLWDVQLCWIAMGYRMSRQRSLAGYSPYFLLFGRWPIVGAILKQVLTDVVDLDDPKVWASVVMHRAEIFEKEMPIAFNNLAIAQHRDTLRYSHKRSGDYKPKLKRFAIGDLVYLKRQKADSMDPKVGRIILQVVGVEPNGLLVLEGRDRKRIRDHVENCAPCYNPNIDLWQNPELAREDLDQECQVCHKTKVTPKHKMLLCDKCNEGWHMKCLTPVLTKIPKGDWFCPRCVPLPETDRPRRII